MVNKKIKMLLDKDFSTLFDNVLLFRELIPKLARMIGVRQFYQDMKMTKSQYYSRTRQPDKWKLSELIRASEIFKEHNLGKN